MYTTFFEPANTLPPGVTPCLAMFVVLLRSATGCNSGVTFSILLALHRFLGSGISRASLGAITDHIFLILLHPTRGGDPGVTFSGFFSLPHHFFTATKQGAVGSHRWMFDVLYGCSLCLLVFMQNILVVVDPLADFV